MTQSSRPLRIWEIISGPQLNGAVLQAKWVAEELAARGHEVTVVGRTGSWLLDQDWPDTIRLIASDMDRWPLSRPLAMARQAKAEGVDVFHSHMTRADNYGLPPSPLVPARPRDRGLGSHAGLPPQNQLGAGTPYDNRPQSGGPRPI